MLDTTAAVKNPTYFVEAFEYLGLQESEDHKQILMSCDDRGFGLSLGLLPFTHARGDRCPVTTEVST